MPFNGTLNSNEIFSSIYNMIISQSVMADNIKGTNSALVEAARVDGSMYGDTKLYYATDALFPHDWNNDAEATNLLAIDRPADPKVQTITIDTFKQIRVTLDNYMSKRAFSTEGAFQSFNDVMRGWLRDTKRIYDSTIYNTYIGTTEAWGRHELTPDTGSAQKITITPVEGQNDALTMAEALADILVKLTDVSRDYNSYGFMRSYDESDLIVIWNAKHYNTLKKIDMPQIFHNEGLLSEFKQYVLPEHYFGVVEGNPGETTNLTDNTFYARVPLTVENKNFFAGEKITVSTDTPADSADIYTLDDAIAFKIMHKDSVPYMSGFEVGTSFFNPRSLTETNYLTFGHNTLEFLKDKPFIVARFNEA